MQLPLESGKAKLPVFEDKQIENARVIEKDEAGHIVKVEKDGVVYLDGAMKACFDRPISGLDCIPGWGWRDAFAQARALQEHVLRVKDGGASYAYADDQAILVDVDY